MSLFRILCIDGGGMNALASAVVLSKFESYLAEYSQKKDTRLCDYFDFFSGTSAGGILCGAYLCPATEFSKRPLFSAEETINEYIKIGKEIFKPPCLRNFRTVAGLFGSKYPAKRLTKAFDKVFGNTRLSDCLKPCLIPAYNIVSGKCVFYDRENAKAYTERDYYLKDVLRATSSAPSYFPPAVVTTISGIKSCMIDGGVFANNPAMCSYIEANKFKEKYDEVHDKKIAILSIGLGKPYDRVSCHKAGSWGKISWALPILGIFMNAVSQTTDYQLRTIFKSDYTANSRYLRIDGTSVDGLPELGAMDDASDQNIEKCIKYGERLSKIYEARMRSFAKMLSENQ